MREGWAYKKLGEVCKTSSGGTPSKNNLEYYEGGTIPWLRSGEVAQGLIYDSELCITESGLNNSSAKLFPVDTVVLAMYGATVGQVGLLKREMATNQAICGIFPNNKLYPLFLLYSLKAKRPIFLKDAVGGAQPNISQSLIKNTTIPIPPISEQERIVSELDLLSSVIEKKKAQLEEYDQLAQSIFYDMFGDILNSSPTKTLKDIASYYIGLTYKPSDVSDEGTVVLRSSNIQNNILDFEDTVRVNVEIKDNKYVQDGDILMCARNGSARLVGKVAKIKNISERMSFGAFMTIIRSKYNEYLFHFFLSDYFRNQLITSKTATINQITTRMLDNIKLNVPPFSLQQQFAKKIEAIEKQKEQIKQSIAEVETLFNSRMDYYFN